MQSMTTNFQFIDSVAIERSSSVFAGLLLVSGERRTSWRPFRHRHGGLWIACEEDASGVSLETAIRQFAGMSSESQTVEKRTEVRTKRSLGRTFRQQLQFHIT
jgi:hypothetical protein